MQTEVVRVDRTKIDAYVMEKAGKVLKSGGLVAFPTETVYGLGADALDWEAAKKLSCCLWNLFYNLRKRLYIRNMHNQRII